MLLALLATPFLAHAQAEGPGYISIRFAVVKPDAVPQFEAAIKDIGAALRKGGAPFFHVYERMRGEQGYTIVSLDGAYNDLPQIELDPRLIQRVTATLNSTSVLTAEMHPDLSIQESFEPLGNFMYVRVRTTSQANRQAYFEWQRDQLVPALRQAGIKDRRGGRVVAGGNINTFVDFSYSEKFDDGIDVPAAVGERRWQQILAGGAMLINTAEDFRYRFRRDLGFTADQPAVAANP